MVCSDASRRRRIRCDNLSSLKFNTGGIVDCIDEDTWRWELRGFRSAIVAVLTVDDENWTGVRGVVCHSGMEGVE